MNQLSEFDRLRPADEHLDASSRERIWADIVGDGTLASTESDVVEEGASVFDAASWVATVSAAGRDRTGRRRLALVGAAAVAIVGLGALVAVQSTRDTPPEVGRQDSVPSQEWVRVPHDEAVFGGSAMKDVIVGGPGLVAVGATAGVEGPLAAATADTSAVVWTSTDGITWSRVPHDDAVFGGAVMRAVVAHGDRLVAVGFDSSPVLDAVVWTSTDGINWARLPTDETVFGGAEMFDVAVGGPGLVAVGTGESGPAVWTSTDGTTWSRVPDDEAASEPLGSGMFRVTVGGPGLVAVGWDMSADRIDAAVWTSADGIRWSRVVDDEAVFSRSALFGVAAGEEGLVAVGEVLSGGGSDAAVWTSPDGMTWSRVPHDEAAFGGGTILDVTTVGASLVVVGERGSATAVWTSLDGIRWSRVVDNEAGSGRSALWGVTATDAGSVAVGWDLSRGNSDAAVWGN